ncbi:MAG: TRAP transporter large permease subunit [Thermoanaerobaculia bacterium]
MALLVGSELVVRQVGGGGIPGALPLLQHLTLWLGYLGAAYAAREGKLLAIASSGLFPEGRWRNAAAIFSGAIGAAVSILLARASFEMVKLDREAGGVVALGIPVWVAQLVLPVAFLILALRLAWMASKSPGGRALAALGLAVGLLLGQYPAWTEGAPKLAGLALLLFGAIAGAPLFVLLGGAAVWLFLTDGVPIAAVPIESYRLAVHPTLPSIPLFTLTGFLLAESKAAVRLLALFRAAVGWLPGGTAVVTAILCAFFTTFTGGSGVTILALGALLFQTLSAERYRERFSLGLLTSSGALGLLYPPALPLIFYGIVASVSIPDLFKAGVLPGTLMVLAVAAWGLREGRRSQIGGQPFDARVLGRAAWDAKWEIFLPVLIVVLMLTGRATAVEAAGASVVYAALVGLVIHRDIAWRRLPHVLRECVLVIGGVLLILGVALGLTSYLVDAQVPMRLLAWAQAHISSKWIFLLALNLLLLVVGCLMDIFSAIAVVVPLIVPLALAYGVDPVHLGIIFIANLELGFLTPPVGVNLFLASYRFDRPMSEIVRAVLPFLFILAAGVLVITYVPWLTLAFLKR